MVMRRKGRQACRPASQRHPDVELKGKVDTPVSGLHHHSRPNAHPIVQVGNVLIAHSDEAI